MKLMEKELNGKKKRVGILRKEINNTITSYNYNDTIEYIKILEGRILNIENALIHERIPISNLISNHKLTDYNKLLEDIILEVTSYFNVESSIVFIKNNARDLGEPLSLRHFIYYIAKNSFYITELNISRYFRKHGFSNDRSIIYNGIRNMENALESIIISEKKYKIAHNKIIENLKRKYPDI